jgi:AcrR family transcriptional regulator
MARWKPNARERLVASALELFAARGYEETTVVEIAEHAGLTKSTFFRHFKDKREVLFGGDTMAELLAEGIAAAPATAGPLDTLAHALDLVGRQVFTPDRRSFAARRLEVIAANPELQEREALKGLALTASIAEALAGRNVPELTALVAAQLGALGLKLAYERWSDPDSDGEFGAVARRTLWELRAASASC